MSNYSRNIINNYCDNNQITFKIKHPEIEKVEPRLSICRIAFEKSNDVADFNIRLPLIVDYFEILSEIFLVNGKIVNVKEQETAFNEEYRVEKSLLSKKDYKMGLHFVLHYMDPVNKNIILNILKDYNNKEEISNSDLENIDDEIFECFMISSNSLDRFVSSVPNLHKLSMVLKDAKDKFVVGRNGSIHVSNWESVVEEFLNDFLNVRFL